MAAIDYTLPTEIGDLSIRQARADELESFLSVLEDAEQWLATQAIPQWPQGCNRKCAQFFQKEIEKGVVYLVWQGSELVGTFILSPPSWLDKKIWEELLDDALYLHRLTIRRAFSGHSIGQAILKWCEKMTLASGKRFLRIDCSSDNKVLNRFCESAGFAFQSHVGGQGWNVSLFEKRIEPIGKV